MADAPAESRIRGTVLRARLQYVREAGGEEKLREVLARLPEADRTELTGMVLPVAWYPLALNLRLDAAIAAVLSPGDPRKVFLEMGRASADSNLMGNQRPYVREGDPHFLLSAASRIYATYYAVGHRTYEKLGDRAVVLRTFDAETISANDCLTVVGWHKRAIELCGGKDVKVVETQCRAQGAPHCEYRCEWS
jgi:uncharacterized protein (TIGR02265 family)